MNKTRRKLLIGGGISISLLILFFIQNYIFYKIPHNTIQTNIQRLSILDFQVTERVLTAGAKSFYNYDQTRAIQVEEAAIYQELTSLLQKLEQKNLIPYLEKYLDKKIQKEFLLKRFEPANIQLKISLAYLPTISKKINMGLPNAAKKLGPIKILNDLISDVNAYALSNSEQLIPKIELEITNLKSIEFTIKELENIKNRLIDNVSTILQNTQLIQDIIPVITSQNSSNALKELRTHYLKYYEQKLNIINLYRWFFYPLVLVLLLYLGIIIFRLEKAKEDQQSRMTKELSTAQAIQETLFSADNYSSKDIQIAGHYTPATECGGDWWYYSKVNGKYLLWIGDATGHGVSAALITSAARSAASVIEQFDSEMISPGKILSYLNKAIYDSSKGSMMMTFFMAIYDPESRILKYSNAAHEPPAIFNFNNNELTYKKFNFLIEAGGPRLGEKPHFDYAEDNIMMLKDDAILLFSDGALSIKNRDGAFLTERKFFNLVGKSVCTNDSTKETISTLSHYLKRYYDDDILVDDITFFMMRAL